MPRTAKLPRSGLLALFCSILQVPLLLFSSCCCCCCCCCSLLGAVVTVRAQQQPPPPSAECGAELGVVTADQINRAGYRLLEQFIPDDPDLLQRTVNIILLPVRGDVTVRVLCASCEDIDRWYFELDEEFPVYHTSYCDGTSTGYSTPYSFLVLEPRGAGDALPHQVKLRTFVTLPPTSDAAASQQFVTAFFSEGSATTGGISDLLATYLPSLVAASAGAVSLIPDYMGYGNNTEARTVFHQKAYEQAVAVSFLYLRKFIGDQTGECTVIDDAVTIYGVGDGAKAAVDATLVFQRFEVRSLQTFLAAGPLDLDLFLTDVAANYNGGLATSSNGTTSTKETLDEWLELTASTYGSNANAEMVAVRGDAALALDATNPTAYTTACDDNDNATTTTAVDEEAAAAPSLCRALAELGSAWPALRGELDRQWTYPASACYAISDELVSAEHYARVERALLGQDPFLDDGGGTTYQRYTGPTEFDTLAIDDTVANVDHATALKLCSVAPMLFFTLGGFKPEAEEDQGNYQAPMTNFELINCVEATPTPTMTPAPAAPTAPTATPPTSGTGGDGTPTGTDDDPDGAPSGSGGGGDDTTPGSGGEGGGTPAGSPAGSPTDDSPPSFALNVFAAGPVVFSLLLPLVWYY